MSERLVISALVMVIWLQSLGVRADGETAPRIARFKGDAKAAFSYTFDDGFDHQVENALTVIDPLGICGTFFVMPLSMEKEPGEFVTWERLREMNANGHEVGTHASIKPKLHEVSLDVAESIINGGWELIRDKLGVAPVSFAYPGGSRSDVPELQAIVARHHYFVRGKAVGYGSTGTRHWTHEEARRQVREAIERGEWLIAFVHAIIDGYSPFKSMEDFERHSRWLVGQGDDLWIAPMGTVGRYVDERDSASLKVIQSGRHSISFELHCEMLPREVYNLPLTIVVEVPDGADLATVRDSSGEPVDPVAMRDGKVLLDVLPGSGPLTIEWE